MAGETTEGGTAGAASGVRSLLFGDEDPRLRATWRLLLAVPLVLSTQFVARAVTGALGVPGMVPTGLAQAGWFGLLFVLWARYVDRRAIRNYGLTLSTGWLRDAVVAFSAVVVGYVVWYGGAAALGVASLAVAADASLAVALAGAFVALAVNVWVQDTVYFGLVLRNAAEGAGSRGLTARRAVLAGWVVAAAFFVVIHGEPAGRVGTLGVAGAVFGLLYVLTGDLSVPIGFHLGLNFVGGWLFLPADAGGPTAVSVSGAAPVVGSAARAGQPQMVVALALVVGWLWWTRDDVGVATDIARWRGR
ncbi:CPBP family intramembrane glutamic endopeptidase [Halorarius halobius]|uniref:CPBP family intramembrane glutamic endopeptidase n=1 Tax=Halorarius halobius TaxID=2962671 RepID=UPI0020CC4990|nr:CPBP family intramembrane glutamic endopeptidase [Halorarius halobius]